MAQYIPEKVPLVSKQGESNGKGGIESEEDTTALTGGEDETDVVEEIIVPCFIDDRQVPTPWSQVVSATQGGFEINFSYENSIQKDAPKTAIPLIDEDIGTSNREAFKQFLKDDYGKNISNETFTEQLRNELNFLSMVGHQTKLEVLCDFLHSKQLKLHDLWQTSAKASGTALHFALLMGNNSSIKTLLQSLNDFREKCTFVEIAYPEECQQYAGTNALHIAIAQENADCLREIFLIFSGNMNQQEKDLALATKKKLFAQEVTGAFFPDKYKARFALAMAASTGNIEIFNLLVKNGAQVDQEDSVSGNTILHSLVLDDKTMSKDKINMLRAIFESQDVLWWWKGKREDGKSNFTASPGHEPGLMKRYLLQIRNKTGETPLKLACRRNCSPMIRAILEVDQAYRFTQWRFGSTWRVLYDVTGLSPGLGGSLSTKNNCQDNICVGDRCLEDLVYSSECVFGTSRDLEWGNITPITKLMDLRWEAYKVRLLLFFLLHLFLMIILSASVDHSASSCKERNNSSNFTISSTVTDTFTCITVWHIISNALLAIIVMVYILSEILAVINIIHDKGTKTCLGIFKSIFVKEGLFGIVLFLFLVTSLFFLIFRFTNIVEAHIAFLALSALTGWVFILIFTRVFKGICIFTVMLQRIIFGDLFHVTVVFLAITLGFATALRAVFWGQTPPEDLGSLSSIIHTLFHVMLTGEPLDVTGQHRFEIVLIKILVTLFIILSTVQLLNMLIAAMTDTYTEVSQKKTQVWRQNREKVVLFLERRLPKRLQPHFCANFEEKDMPAAESIKKDFTTTKRKHWFLAIEEAH